MEPRLYRRSSVVCRSVCLSRWWTLQKTAEPIEMPFGIWTRVGPRRHVLEGVYWRHLANTIERPICGGDTAFPLVTNSLPKRSPNYYLYNL